MRQVSSEEEDDDNGSYVAKMQLDEGVLVHLEGAHQELRALRAEMNGEMKMMRVEVTKITTSLRGLEWVAREWWKQNGVPSNKGSEAVDEDNEEDDVGSISVAGDQSVLPVAEGVPELIAEPFTGPSTLPEPST